MAWRVKAVTLADVATHRAEVAGDGRRKVKESAAESCRRILVPPPAEVARRIYPGLILPNKPLPDHPPRQRSKRFPAGMLRPEVARETAISGEVETVGQHSRAQD